LLAAGSVAIREIYVKSCGLFFVGETHVDHQWYVIT